jgi:D-3-phosphoglycerate dehydrogenase
MFHIKTYNKIAPKGLRRFAPEKYAVGPEVSNPEAYILRSHKLHGEEIPSSLLAVARAGAGVNNLPVADYTKLGVVAFNTPGANANAVKELVLAAMLLSSRDIIGSRAFVETLGHMTDSAEMSKLLEDEKKRFAGSELKGKTLGVVGLGAIGSMVAETALAMGMDVLGYDPALSVEAAWRLPNQVQRKESLNALLMASDYVSLHVPAIAATKHLINKDTLAVMKPHASLINFARESIVDPEAIVHALEAGKLRQYVCDFPEPVLIGRKGVIALPHIGASTEEAEENCAVMAADQIRDYLENGNITNSVNFPAISMSRVEGTTRITFTNDNVAGVLGDVLSIFAEHNVNVIDMTNKSRDAVAYNILDLAVAPPAAALEALRKVKHVIRVRVIPA